MNNYDPHRPVPQYACPHCPAVFVAPNARLHHLEEAHGDTPDTSGAEAAVSQLQALLQRTHAKYMALLGRRADRAVRP